MPCLLFDLREHGISDGTGKGFTYGTKEKNDVVAAASFALSRPGVCRVLLCGTSVGGASVVLAGEILKDRVTGKGGGKKIMAVVQKKEYRL